MKILLCDDALTFLEDLKTLLKENLPEDTDIHFSRNREEIQTILIKEEFNLLLMDICLEDDNGILLAKNILEKYPQMPVIFITGYPDLYYEKVFLTIRPWGFIKKPVDREILLKLIEKNLYEDQSNKKEYLFVKTKSALEKILISDIYYRKYQTYPLHTSEEQNI